MNFLQRIYRIKCLHKDCFRMMPAYFQSLSHSNFLKPNNPFMNAQRLLKHMMASVLFMLAGLFAVAQQQVITTSGTVADAKSGVGLPGVSVSVKGGTIGTTTNSEGNFTLRVPAGSVLTFSSVGYTDKDLPAEDGAMFIMLDPGSAALNEVVVVGYGTVRKKDLTGAITTVTAKDFQTGNIQSPDQLIAGKVAGVQITPNGGAPGAGSTIRIRGGSSLTATNDPLIVIDGVPVDGGIAGSPNPLSLINPNDIESFNILKDASATAIYGSRASNGVIIITTKKGKRGKPQWNFGTSLIVASPDYRVDVLGADEYRKLINERGTPADIAKMGTASTDWQDEIYQTALGTDNNLSVSGALGNMPYRVSAGYLNQDGILRTDNLQRITGSINLSPRLLNNHLKVDLNLKASNSKNFFADQGAISSSLRWDPTQPVRSGKDLYGGFKEWEDPGSTSGLLQLAPNNPVGLLEQREDKSNVNRYIGNIQLDYKFHFLPELRANLNVGGDFSKGTGTIKIPPTAATQLRGGRAGTNNEYAQENENRLAEFYLNYATDLKGIDSRIDVMAGYSYQDFLSINRFFNDRLFNGQDNPATADPIFDVDYPRYTLISYFGRLNYTLANKYLLTATLRRDGSSRFSPDNRWGMFPSVALAWKIAEESFMGTNSVFSDLKLRVGYGVTGQQDIGDRYAYIPRYSQANLNSSYWFGTTPNLNPIYLPQAYNQFLKWEETGQFNIGVDFGLFEDKITGSLEYFNKNSNDLLFRVPIPVGSNFINQLVANIGDLRVTGGELTVNYTPIRTEKSRLDLSFNATYLDREITQVRGDEDPSFKGVEVGGIAGGTGNNIQILSKGFAPNAFYVFKQVYNQDGNPIEGLYEDLNRDGIVNQDDRYRYKKPDADVFLGFSTQYSINRFSTGFVMRASIGNYVYNNVFSERGVFRQVIDPLGYLQNTVPNALETNFFNNQYFSDYYVQNASFLRMDNFNVGYDFGNVFGKGTNLRASANIQNAFVITKYEGIDPEVQGIDNQYYPRPRTYTLGLNLGF
jgi:TonB-dependent starch-binding outer membrane protein SusC